MGRSRLSSASTAPLRNAAHRVPEGRPLGTGVPEGACTGSDGVYQPHHGRAQAAAEAAQAVVNDRQAK